MKGMQFIEIANGQIIMAGAIVEEVGPGMWLVNFNAGDGGPVARVVSTQRMQAMHLFPDTETLMEWVQANSGEGKMLNVNIVKKDENPEKPPEKPPAKPRARRKAAGGKK